MGNPVSAVMFNQTRNDALKKSITIPSYTFIIKPLTSIITLIATLLIMVAPASVMAANHGLSNAAPMTLYIVRHGQTDWNLQGRIQGDTDNPLNETGLDQARTVAEQLGTITLDHVYPSGLQRAIQTAEAIAGDAPITSDVRLNERSRGIYEGQVAAEVNDAFRPRFSALDDDMDGGESLRSIAERISEATRDIVDRHMGETVMVVGHSGVNPLVIAELIGLPPERAINEIRQGNDEVYKLTVFPNGAVTIWKLIPENRLEEL